MYRLITLQINTADNNLQAYPGRRADRLPPSLLPRGTLRAGFGGALPFGLSLGSSGPFLRVSGVLYRIS